LLIFGYNRIPIVSWLRQAIESLAHSHAAGEMITSLGAYPSLEIGKLLDSHQHDISTMLRESLENESKALEFYKELLREVEGKSVMLEEYARQMILTEETHAGEVNKMLRRPGDLKAYNLE
jgi:bacterioferritin